MTFLGRGAVLALVLLSSGSMRAGSLATVQVGATPGQAIPRDFEGLSFEYGAGYYFGTTTTPNTLMIRLMRNLGSGELRIGGDSTDAYCWDPVCSRLLTLTETAAIMDAAQLAGWTLTLGVNLAISNTANAVDFAKAMKQQLVQYPGCSLVGLEVGNEPDWYVGSGRYPATYTLLSNVAQ